MRATTRTRSDQRGETLLELLVAVSILGTGVVALVGSIGASVVLSDVHRKEATSGAVVRTYAEAIETGVRTGSSGAYVACGKPPAYQSPAGFTVPAGYTTAVAEVSYWSTATKTFEPKCGSDSGAQRLTLIVSSTDARAKETLSLVIRKPCLTASACA